MYEVYFWVGFIVVNTLWVVPTVLLAALLLNGIAVTVSRIIFFSLVVVRFPDARSKNFSWYSLLTSILKQYLMNCFITDQDEISIPGKGLWCAWNRFSVMKPRQAV